MNTIEFELEFEFVLDSIQDIDLSRFYYARRIGPITYHWVMLYTQSTIEWGYFSLLVQVLTLSMWTYYICDSQ